MEVTITDEQRDLARKVKLAAVDFNRAVRLAEKEGITVDTTFTQTEHHGIKTDWKLTVKTEIKIII